MAEVNPPKTAIADETPLNDLSFDGIPQCFLTSPNDAVATILNKIAMNEMMKFFVGARELKKAKPSARASIVDQFTSENMCDNILRARGVFVNDTGGLVLTADTVFQCVDNSAIFINKMLPGNTYKLLSEARKRKRAANVQLNMFMLNLA